MKVKIGSSSSVIMNDDETAKAIQRYFAEHGVDLKHVHIGVRGDIEFKMSDGFKIILNPHRAVGYEVLFC